MVGVHKRNVSSQNHSQNTTLDDHSVYEIIYLVNFLFLLDNHVLLDEMLVIFCDLDD
jgi:hypothetical protein